MSTIDFHTHVYPSPPMPQRLSSLRNRIADALSPIATLRHQAQAFARHLPESLQMPFDQLGTLTVGPNLLIESTAEDHQRSLLANHVDRALVVAFPPVISNEFILRLSGSNPRLIPAVAMSRTENHIEKSLETFHQQGVRILKVHPIYDGISPVSQHYLRQLDFAAANGWAVIIHTGIIRSVFFRAPEFGAINFFLSWFQKYPKLNFFLAHTGYHQGEETIQAIQSFPHVSALLSYQPKEIIGKAVATLGADRCLYASDWPLLGNSMTVALNRISDAEKERLLTRDQADLIRGGNALRALKTCGIALKEISSK